MPRRLDKRLKLDPESERLELLDWRNSDRDFERLCEYVLKRLNSRLSGISAEQIFPMEVLRDIIRHAAEAFEEKNISLPFFVYMWLKAVVGTELAKRGQVGLWKRNKRGGE